MNAKSVFASRTMWFNVGVCVLAAFEVMQDKDLSWKTICLGVVAAINMALRICTNKPIR